MFDNKRLEALEECCKEHRHRVEKLMKIDNDVSSELKLLRVHLERHQEVFENHDTKEMEKYDEIRKSISKMNAEIIKFNKFFWIAFGAIAVLNFLGVTEIVKHNLVKIYQESKQERR